MALNEADDDALMQIMTGIEAKLEATKQSTKKSKQNHPTNTNSTSSTTTTTSTTSTTPFDLSSQDNTFYDYPQWLERLLHPDNNIYCPTERDTLQVDEYEACCEARFANTVKEFDLSSQDNTISRWNCFVAATSASDSYIHGV